MGEHAMIGKVEQFSDVSERKARSSVEHDAPHHQDTRMARLEEPGD